MAHEATKAAVRRMFSPSFATRYFVGEGIDIGCGDDNLYQFHEQFPLMNSCRGWDMEDGDAQTLAGVSDKSYDFVHSSHSLEHMVSPSTAIQNWYRVLKSGGYMIVLVPDEDLYERGDWPSKRNGGHLSSWTIQKNKSWSPASFNVTSLFGVLRPEPQIIKIELLDHTFFRKLDLFDQTGTIAECAIEFIIRKPI